MAIIWDKAWNVGNAEIDKQHQHWVEIFNRFENACLNDSYQNAYEYKKDAIQELYEYTDYHFKTEEEVMNEHDYPEAAKHWRMHKDFKNSVYKKFREFEDDGPILGSQLLSLMEQWIVDHILIEDRKLVLFLESQGSHESCRCVDDI